VIKISRTYWDEIGKATIEARKNKIPIMAFFLYARRGNPLTVIDIKEVPVKLLKAESNSGPIFRWGYAKGQHVAYYPKGGGTRYGGTALINQVLFEHPLGLSLHYAYWMGVDFKLSAGINISLWCNDVGEVKYKACYVNAAKTNGEFVECSVQTSDVIS
jgi:hypothetical protein